MINLNFFRIHFYKGEDILESGDAIQLILLLVLLLLSAFFSSAETALTTVNQIRIKTKADEGDKRAKRVLLITADSGKMLSAILIGNNIVNITASSVATLLADKLFGNAGVTIATAILTVLILIFGEITPKTMATIYAEKLSLAYSGVIYTLMKILTPVIFIINKLSTGFLLLLHVDPSKKNTTMTEIELRTIVDASHDDGVIESTEREMINNVFDFGDSLAKDVMVPRIDMTFAQVDSTREELIALFRENKYTRIPVYEDTTDNVIGILNMKDLLLCDNDEDFHIRDILREAYFTYEFKNTSELMIEMRKNAINIAIVLDEYGTTAGLITLEDLLEEIVGDIRDEYDDDEEEMLQQINNLEYLAEGSMKIDDINTALDLELESDDYDSIGGFIIEHLDHLPEEKESITLENGITLEVESVEKNRIDKVHIYFPESVSKDAKMKPVV